MIRTAGRLDAAALAALAAATFPLACPPDAKPEAIADFIATQLAESNFAAYLADPDREILIAELDGAPTGYTMLVYGEPTDADVLAAITVRPTAELSKCYVLASAHGSGLATELMAASIQSARDHGAGGLWLGVNNENAKANRFYEKSGFVTVGTKRFHLGDRWEDDFVRELVL